MKTQAIVSLASLFSSTSAFVVVSPAGVVSTTTTTTTRLLDSIVSPFDNSNEDSDGVATFTPTDPVESNKGPLDLTEENVELVLDEMRPYLIQDGGNVAITEIDGPVVRLELQVSTVPTLKFLELHSKEANPYALPF